MKNSIFTFLLVSIFCALSTQTSFATNPISPEASIEMDGENFLVKDIKKETKFTRFLQKIKNGAKKIKQKIKSAYYKVAGMFSDPVRKWMWFWLLFGLLAVILITVAVIAGIGTGSSALFQILYYLGIGSSLFSSVSFVVWIVKLIQG